MRYLLVLVLLTGCATESDIKAASSADLCGRYAFNEGLSDEGYRVKVLELERRNVVCGERIAPGFAYPPTQQIIVVNPH